MKITNKLLKEFDVIVLSTSYLVYMRDAQKITLSISTETTTYTLSIVLLDRAGLFLKKQNKTIFPLPATTISAGDKNFVA